MSRFSPLGDSPALGFYMASSTNRLIILCFHEKTLQSSPINAEKATVQLAYGCGEHNNRESQQSLQGTNPITAW